MKIVERVFLFVSFFPQTIDMYGHIRVIQRSKQVASGVSDRRTGGHALQYCLDTGLIQLGESGSQSANVYFLVVNDVKRRRLPLTENLQQKFQDLVRNDIAVFPAQSFIANLIFDFFSPLPPRLYIFYSLRKKRKKNYIYYI